MTAPDVRPLSIPLTTLLIGSLDVDWRQARCAVAGENPEDWFPFPTDDFSHAADVCARCPIRLPCVEFGVANRCSGVWGGHRLDGGRMC